MGHRHVPVRETEAGFRGCVRPHECNCAAHGNVTVTEHCRCGATRRLNVNQAHIEAGPWEDADTEPAPLTREDGIVMAVFRALREEGVRNAADVADRVFWALVRAGWALPQYR